MLSNETFSAFFLASTLLAIAPGPDNVFVLTQSALHGKLSGLVVVFGLCTGLLVHTAAVAFGVAVIFQASTLAFTLLKIIGAGYLVYLAILPMSLLLLERPVWIVITYAVTGAIFMPLLAALLLYMNSSRSWLGEHANGWPSKVLLSISLLVFGYLLVLELLSRLPG